ncbi:unnamed protein product [Sphagnum troendelagicum]
MAMITRLQEEKALVQMEARQYQRMVEEKTMYDQEAMEVLKEVIARHEEEKNELEEEIRICKRKLRLWESRSKMRTQDGRTGSSESSRKVISRIVEEEDNPLCQWLFQEGVVMGRNHLDPSSSLMEREDNSGTGKLEEESESQGMDDETLGLMMGGEHAEEEECIDRQWEGFCDDNIRSNSSTISRDSACRVPVEDEVMHLTLRLKALEADRNLMKQTIESLRRENGEMKLLQEIAQQLRELRGLEQKDLRQQSKPLAAASPCQGMMSFAHLCNSAQTQLSKLACVCLGNSSTMDYPGESRIGLGHLLHSSPKPSTCVTQLRRANIPSTLSAIQSMALQPQETSNQPLQSG